MRDAFQYMANHWDTASWFIGFIMGGLVALIAFITNDDLNI